MQSKIGFAQLRFLIYEASQSKPHYFVIFLPALKHMYLCKCKILHLHVFSV